MSHCDSLVDLCYLAHFVKEKRSIKKMDQLLDDDYIVQFMRKLEDRATMHQFDLDEADALRKAMR